MSERKVLWRWFWAWDFEKEERWLNEMAMQGWLLVQVGFCRYTFEKGEPGSYIYRLQMRQPEPEYLAFLEDLDAEYVDRFLSWLYIRRRSELGPFEIFSDNKSRLEHLEWIGRIELALGVMNLVIGIVNSLNAQPVGAVNMLVGTLLMYGLGRIHGKIEEIKRDQELQE